MAVPVRQGRETSGHTLEYRDNRRQENPAEALKGCLQTDGYAGYNSLGDVIRVGCWAYVRIKFNEAVAVLPKGKKGGAALEGEAYCTKLFNIEESLAELPPEERYAKRLELKKPIPNTGHEPSTAGRDWRGGAA